MQKVNFAHVSKYIYLYQIFRNKYSLPNKHLCLHWHPSQEELVSYAANNKSDYLYVRKIPLLYSVFVDFSCPIDLQEDRKF